MVARVAEVAVWWAALFGVWLLTLSSVTLSEAAVAAASALVCAGLATLARSATGQRWRPVAEWVRWLPALPLAVVSDTVAVFAAAIRSAVTRTPAGRGLREVEFGGGRGDAPAAATRRAAATLAVSATPSSVVVDDDPDRGVLVVHQLAAGPVSMEKVVGR